MTLTTEQQDNPVITYMRKAYFLAMSFLFLFIMFCGVTIVLAISRNVNNTEIVNIAGRQRMLSQKINKCALGLYFGQSPGLTRRYRMELEESLGLWNSVHSDFGEGEFRRQNANLFTGEAMRIYGEISLHRDAIAEAAEEILSLTAEPGFERKELNAPLAVINGREQFFLAGMDRMVNLLDSQAEANVIRSRNLVFFLLGAAFVVFLVIILFIFKPVQKYVALSMEEVSRSHEKIKLMAMIDELTGLHNRQYLNTAVSRIMSLAERKEQDLAFLLLDLDRFKRVNDTYGHPVGDRVLKATALLIKDSLRDSDLAVRMGGGGIYRPAPGDRSRSGSHHSGENPYLP